MKDIVIVSGKRTPMAEYGGALRECSALELAAIAARAAIGQCKFEPREFDHAIFGNALQTSGNASYGARHVALKAGLPVGVPALTVNRLCGSGIQSIVSGAQMIHLGEAERVLAGGMENMTQAPHVIRGLRSGLRLGEGKLEDLLMVALMDNCAGLTMAGTAAVLVASSEAAARSGAKPLGRIVSWAFAGVEPRMMGIGPVPAIRKAIERASLGLQDVDLFEINEAFAAQYLAVEKELKLDREK